MKGMKLFLGLTTILIMAPCGFAYSYMLLKRVPEATDLMWFLFWFNSGVGLVLRILLEIATADSKEAK